MRLGSQDPVSQEEVQTKAASKKQAQPKSKKGLAPALAQPKSSKESKKGTVSTQQNPKKGSTVPKEPKNKGKGKGKKR